MAFVQCFSGFADEGVSERFHFAGLFANLLTSQTRNMSRLSIQQSWDANQEYSG